MFTDNLTDHSLASVVRGIQAEGITTFVTPPTGLVSGGMLVYHKAFMNPNKSWTLREITALPAGESNYQIQEKTVVGGVCFFDALHLAAQKFRARVSMGNVVQDAPEIKQALVCADYQTFEEAALKSGQPMDHQGLPLPAASGHILVDGLYDTDALRVASTTRGRAMVTVKAYEPETHNIVSGLTDMRTDASAPAPSTALISKFSVALGAKEKAMAYLERIISPPSRTENKPFKHLTNGNKWFFGILGGGVGIGAGMFLGWPALLALLPAAAAGISLNTPETQVRLRLLRLQFAAHALPDSPQKDMAMEFVTAARGVFHLERAIFLHNKHKENLGKTHYFRQALKEAEKGLRILNVSEEERARILNNMRNGQFAHSGRFLHKLQTLYNTWTTPEQRLVRASTPLVMTAQNTPAPPSSGGNFPIVQPPVHPVMRDLKNKSRPAALPPRHRLGPLM